MKRDAFYALMDQAWVSATNFLVGMYFIHFSTKQEYGSYSIAFGVILLIVSFGSALITTPMTVLALEKESSKQRQFCNSLLVSQYLLLIPVALSVFLLSYALYVCNMYDVEIFLMAIALTFAAFGVLIHEFFRRFNYLMLSPARAFWADFRFSCMLFSLLFVAGMYVQSRLSVLAVALYGLAAGVSGLLSFAIAKFSWTLKFQSVRNALAEAWQYGRWSLSGVSITWIQGQSYAYFLAVLSGTSSIAEANAARLLFAPASMFATSMMNVFMPHMVRLKTAGRLSEAVKLGRKVLVLLLMVTACYAGAVLLCSDWLIGSVFTKQYVDIKIYIVAWVMVILLQSVRANSSALLQIVREFKSIMMANAVSALVVILSTAYLINTYGAVGSIAALAVGEAILAVLLWRIFHRVQKRNYN